MLCPKNPEALLKSRNVRILTPHPGEMARLTGHSIAYIEKNRKRVVLNFARYYTCIVLLKGHRTVIASPQGKWHINKTGNVGMATAGSGDVLTGMIAAFLAQGIPPFDAAVLAAGLHGKAGDYAAKKRTKASMIATDIIDALLKEGPWC